MKVLMFGWEFPPFKSGGLGTACFGLTRALSSLGVKITFVIPKAPYDIKGDYVDLIIGNQRNHNITTITVDSILDPYANIMSYSSRFSSSKHTPISYGNDLFKEVERYSLLAEDIALNNDFDVIHAHDWLSALAGVSAKKVSGKPLILQIHATEFDRTGGNPNPYIYNVEKLGMEKADLIIAVSNYTKSIIIGKYNIPDEKIIVVHNGVDIEDDTNLEIKNDLKKNKPSLTDTNLNNKQPTVLFLGRITIQKGPEYFLEVAKKVLEFEPNARFIVAGNGDMLNFSIQRAAELGISKHVLFAGFLRGKEVDKAFRMADVYVMPSVSEPFGIAPLEAMKNGVPTIISKSSGVSEVIKNCFKVDFWDINEMTNEIVSILNYQKLHHVMSINGFKEVKNMSWQRPAIKVKKIYESMVG